MMIDQQIQLELQLYRTMISQMPDMGVIAFDQEMRYQLAVGQVFLDQGYDPTQFVGKQLHEVVAPPDRTALEQLYQRVLAGETFDLDFESQNRQRTYRLYGCPVQASHQAPITGGMIIVRDITAQKIAATALQESEASLRAILDSATLAMIVADPQYKIREINLAARQRLERRFGQMPQVGELITDYILEHEYKDFMQMFENTLQGQTGMVERYLPGVKDQPMVVRVSYYPVRSSDGEILGVCLISENMTDQWQYRTALEQSERRYQAIIQDQTELICRFHPDGKIFFVNDAYCRYHGRTREALEGQSIFAPISAREQRIIQDHLATLSPDNPTINYDLETEVDGEVRWQNWTDHGIFDHAGRLQEIQSVGRDITAQKQAEIALRVSEERFRLIASATHDYLFDWDVQTDENWVSDSYRALMGQDIDRKTFAGVMGWLTRVHPDDEPVIADLIDQLHQPEVQHVKVSFRLFGADESLVYLEGKIAILRDDNQKPLRIVGALVNVTDRKLAEQQSLRLTIEQEKVVAMTTFINAFSHDFRTPLSVINTSLYLLTHKQHDEAYFQRHIQRIENQINLIEKMIRDLSIITYLDQQSTMDKQLVNVNTLVQQLRDQFTVRTTEKSQTIQIQPDSGHPLIVVNEELIHRALWNLLDNAILYTPTDGTINLVVMQKSGEVMISIQDSGMGISSQDLPHIFTPLYRGEKHSHRPMGNPGMGLPIANKIILLHQGRITVESSEEKGTTFRVFLPLPNNPPKRDQ